jgi:hypothetical protein
MTAAVPTAGPVDTVVRQRVAPSGAPLWLRLPTALGEYRWYGSTRFAGPRLNQQFFLAPAGEHRAIPTHVLPGAHANRRGLRGHDAIVFEAPDRSDACLVLAGPHHEATTWFGGPAPDAAGVERLLTTLRFTDSPTGASLVPTSDLLVRQSDVAVIGRNADSVLVIRRPADVLPSLPDWAGLPLASGGELWRAGRVLPDPQAAMVAGTPHEWRYILAGPGLAMDLVLLGPESGRPGLPLDEAQLLAALGALDGRWTG